MRTLFRRLDEEFEDPDCLVAMTSIVAKQPQLAKNAQELKARMSETCATFVDNSVRDSDCLERAKRFTNALRDRVRTKAEWLEMLHGEGVGAECDAVSSDTYESMVAGICQAHITGKLTEKRNDVLVAEGREAFFEGSDARCQETVEAAW